MPLKSLTTFLIRAWVIISWPFRMPPSSSPMMTSTIAISTRVKPVWVRLVGTLYDLVPVCQTFLQITYWLLPDSM